MCLIFGYIIINKRDRAGIINPSEKADSDGLPVLKIGNNATEVLR